MCFSSRKVRKHYHSVDEIIPVGTNAFQEDHKIGSNFNLETIDLECSLFFVFLGDIGTTIFCKFIP